jgi:1-acyl-sn-glycerol-3-phosphate acyltransferase
MAYALQWLRSAIFIALMYVMMLVLGIIYLIPTIFSRQWAVRACHAYTGWVRWSARVLCGLQSEVRGTPPVGEVLVAAKHQSFFDILVIFDVMPQPKFIMKRELIWAPILGWYALRLGCVPVDRGKRGAAIEKMKQSVAEGRVLPGQLVIYPQGTRVAPGVRRPYKAGAGVLYEQLGQPCVPVATNVGLYWPKRGIYRKPGVAVIEFLPEIAPGRTVAAFMAGLERDIEAASDRLSAEAGFKGGADADGS